MGKNLLWIGLGGFLGSIGRYLTAVLMTKIWSSSFPWGTFVANVLGCLIIGLVYGFSTRMNWMNPEWRLFLATGFCGGYTTFSSFTFENADLLQSGNYGTFALYTLSSFAVGLAAVFAGILLTKL